MDKIIITIQDEHKGFSYDMEIPTTVPMGAVIEKLIGSLALLDVSYPFYRKKWAFQCLRTGTYINKDQTAEECGIWNGDYCIMKEV